jgi:hypothetical protein
VQLVGVATVAAVDAGRLTPGRTPDPAGVLIEADADVDQLTVHLG